MDLVHIALIVEKMLKSEMPPRIELLVQKSLIFREYHLRMALTPLWQNLKGLLHAFYFGFPVSKNNQKEIIGYSTMGWASDLLPMHYSIY